MGPWSRGRIRAPLHFVNEGHQIAAQLQEHGRLAEGGESNAVTARKSYPFFFRPPGHVLLNDAAVGAAGLDGRRGGDGRAGAANDGRELERPRPASVAEFVEDTVFGRRAWRRPAVSKVRGKNGTTLGARLMKPEF
eukprot:SAG22_NODE_122_length_18920_cov_23.494076_24_plen_136_part_00